MFFSAVSMHIPDGFLSLIVSLLLWAAAVAAIAAAIRYSKRNLDERQVPLMGVMAAAIFAGQMLNFTVAGGTSGHLLGAALAAILLGPWPAVLAMSAVVVTQALVFQDGGLLALGANLFNMAFVGVFVAYALYRVFQRISGGKRWGIFVGGFIAAWASIFIASLACALELALSGTSPANLAIPAMGSIHALIGAGEGLITLGALSFIFAARRDLLEKNSGSAAAPAHAVLVVGILVALALAVASPLASAYPDGLEWVAEQNQFIDLAQAPLFEIIPDYVLPGMQNEALATIAAGIIGTLIVLGVSLGVAFNRRKASSQGETAL